MAQRQRQLTEVQIERAVTEHLQREGVKVVRVELRGVPERENGPRWSRGYVTATVETEE